MVILKKLKFHSAQNKSKFKKTPLIRRRFLNSKKEYFYLKTQKQQKNNL
jgi:hypothetical protein